MTAPVEDPATQTGPIGTGPVPVARGADWGRQQEAAREDGGFPASPDDPDGLLLRPSQPSTYPQRPPRRPGSTGPHPVSGQTLRAVLTIGLTFSVVLMVFLGLILRLPPSDFAQYIAPLAGIAGVALGYWFGSDRGR